MNTAANCGESVRRKYQQKGACNIEYIAAMEGFIIKPYPMDDEVVELTFKQYIVIQQSLSQLETYPLIAHAIGHHYLHYGNQIFLISRDRWWGKKTEYQANTFAHHLLIPDDELIICLQSKETVWSLAEKYQVPDWFAHERLKVLKQERPELWQVF